MSGKGKKGASDRAGRAPPAVRLGRKKRSASSRRWLTRQLNDPYVAEAKRQRYRSRAAFKLIELDDRLQVLRPGARVVDLGAAPGGWTQVATERVAADGNQPGGRVVAVDITPMDPVGDAIVLTGDIRDERVEQAVRAALDGPADVVLSDMAPASTGHPGTDHLRIIALAEMALAVAEDILAPGGSFICKVWQGGTEADLLARMKRLFQTTRHIKPPASRPESAELYVIAQGFRPPAD